MEISSALLIRVIRRGTHDWLRKNIRQELHRVKFYSQLIGLSEVSLQPKLTWFDTIEVAKDIVVHGGRRDRMDSCDSTDIYILTDISVGWIYPDKYHWYFHFFTDSYWN